MTSETPPDPRPADEPAPVPTGEPPAGPIPADSTPEPPTPAPVAAAQTEPVAAPPAPSAPVRRRRDRVLGTVGQVMGILGILVCALLVVGVVLGRGWAVSTVNDVATSVDTQIAKVVPLLDTAHTAVGDVSERARNVSEIAAVIAADPNPGGEIADRLRTALGDVNDKYQGLREGYAGVRETVVALIDTLQALDRLIPGLTVPQGPVDALATFDTRLQEFDAKVNDLLTIEPGAGPLNEAAARISQASSGLDSRLQGVQEAITGVQDRVATLRTDIGNVADTVDAAITFVTVFIVLLLLWLALLHWVLFRHSGEIRRKTTAG